MTEPYDPNQNYEPKTEEEVYDRYELTGWRKRVGGKGLKALVERFVQIVLELTRLSEDVQLIPLRQQITAVTGDGSLAELSRRVFQDETGTYTVFFASKGIRTQIGRHVETFSLTDELTLSGDELARFHEWVVSLPEEQETIPVTATEQLGGSTVHPDLLHPGGGAGYPGD